MQQIDNKKFYQKAIKEFGVSAQGVHWNSKYSQYKRFEVLTQFIKEDIPHTSIVDAGCGFAEYYNYLRKNALLPKQYLGLDCEHHMIQIAKQRYPKLEFYTKDVLKDKLPYADYYVCSGAMNLLNKADFFEFITQCYSHSHKGFVFNFLKEDSFNQINPREVIEHCKQLNGSYIIEDDYLDNDLSIFLKKS